MRCSKCRGELPTEAFAANRRAVIGRQAYCKPCFRAYLKDRRIAMKLKRIEAEDSCPESALYIFMNERIPDQIKIGRSLRPEARAAALEASQNFRVIILAVFPRLGHLEFDVHRLLEHYRVLDVPSHEWFTATAATAVGAIMEAATRSKTPRWTCQEDPLDYKSTWGEPYSGSEPPSA